MTEIGATRIARGSAYLFVQDVVIIATDIVGFAFIARMLTQTEIGVTVALTLIVAFAWVFSDLGFSRALIKYIAEYRGRNEDYTALSLTGVLMEASVAVVLAVVCALGAPQLSELFLKSREYTSLFQLLGIDLLFSCIKTTLYDTFIGLDEIPQAAVLYILSNFARQVSVVALLFGGYGLTGLLIGWIIGDLFFTVPSVLIMLKGKDIRVHPIGEIASKVKLFFRFSWPLFVTDIVFFIFGWFDRALLLSFTSLSSVAVYEVACKPFVALITLPRAMRMSLLPYYSEQYGRGSRESIISGVGTSSRLIALIYTPLALGLMVTANPVIALLAGPVYSGGEAILAILSLAAMISGINAAFVGLLFVYNKTPMVLLSNITSVGVGLAASLVLLPSLGVTGMAIARGSAMITLLLVNFAVLRKVLPLKFDREAMWKSLSAAIIMVLAVWGIQQIHFHPYLLPIYVLIGGITYTIALRILKAVNENDIQLVRNLVGNRAPFLMNALEKIFPYTRKTQTR